MLPITLLVCCVILELWVDRPLAASLKSCATVEAAVSTLWRVAVSLGFTLRPEKLLNRLVMSGPTPDDAERLKADSTGVRSVTFCCEKLEAVCSERTACSA